jgi:hypothetical protein
LLRTKILLLFVLVSASSCPKRPAEVVYLPARENCLTEPPPKERKVVPVLDETCPPQFALCLDADAGLDLEHNIRQYRRWAAEVWVRCSPLPTGADGGVDGGL